MLRDSFSATFNKFDKKAKDAGEKSGSAFGGMRGAIGAAAFAYAAVQATQALASFASEATVAGAQLRDLEASYGALAAQQGVNSQALVRGMNEVAKGNLTAAETMKNLNFALQAMGSPLAAAAPRLYEMARAAALAQGDISKLDHIYSTLMTGIIRGSPRLIDNANIFIKAGEANEEYAKSLGKTVSELSAQEKQLATLNAVLADYETYAELSAAVADSETEKINKLNKAWQERIALIGKTITKTEAYQQVVLGLTSALKPDPATEGVFLRINDLIEDMYSLSFSPGSEIDSDAFGKVANEVSNLKADLDNGQIGLEDFYITLGKLYRDLPTTGMPIDKDIQTTLYFISQAIEEMDRLKGAQEEVVRADTKWQAYVSSISPTIPGVTGFADEFDKEFAKAAAKVADLGAVMEKYHPLSDWYDKELLRIARMDNPMDKQIAKSRLDTQLADLIAKGGEDGAAALEASLRSAVNSALGQLSGFVSGLDIPLGEKIALYDGLQPQLEAFMSEISHLAPEIQRIMLGDWFGSYKDMFGAGGSSRRTGGGGPIDGLIDSASDLESIIDKVVQKSTTVTAEDMIFTQMGKYADTAFEQVKRLNDVVKLGIESPNLQYVQHLFSPEALANADLLKIEAKQIAEDIANLMMPQEVNMDKFAQEFEAELNRVAQKSAGLDVFINELSKRGLLSGTLAQRKSDFLEMIGVEDPEVTMQSLFDTVDQKISDTDVAGKLMSKLNKDMDKEKEVAATAGEKAGQSFVTAIMSQMESGLIEQMMGIVEKAWENALTSAGNQGGGGGSRGGYQEYE